MYIYISFISMTNKSVMTFFLWIKYLSVCLYVRDKVWTLEDTPCLVVGGGGVELYGLS